MLNFFNSNTCFWKLHLKSTWRKCPLGLNEYVLFRSHSMCFFVMKRAYSSPDSLTVFCNLQISRLGGAFVFVSVYFIFTRVYSGLHLACPYKLRSLKVPWLPRASADVMHEESSCLFTPPKGMLKEPDS